MLSKLRYGGVEIRQSGEPAVEQLTAGLRAMFGDALTGLSAVPGGTLGIGFKADLHGQPRFFKTHAVPSGRLSLQREAAFLKATAAAQADPRLVQVAEGTTHRAWMHTRLLDPCETLSSTEVRALIATYEAALQKYPELAGDVPASDSIHQLLSEAEAALAFMTAKHLLSPAVTDAVRCGIDHLKVVCADLPLQLCHGDLGIANIMIAGNSPVALDWEDVFWGISGYDYLYWLTFFGNRKWLSRDALGHTSLTPSTEIALMLVILLLKSWMSVRDGSYLRNTMTFDQRLQEVIDLG